MMTPSYPSCCFPRLPARESLSIYKAMHVPRLPQLHRNPDPHSTQLRAMQSAARSVVARKGWAAEDVAVWCDVPSTGSNCRHDAPPPRRKKLKAREGARSAAQPLARLPDGCLVLSARAARSERLVHD